MNSIDSSKVNQAPTETPEADLVSVATFDPQDLVKLQQLKNQRNASKTWNSSEEETALGQAAELFQNLFGVPPEWKGAGHAQAKDTLAPQGFASLAGNPENVIDSQGTASSLQNQGIEEGSRLLKDLELLKAKLESQGAVKDLALIESLLSKVSSSQSSSPVAAEPQSETLGADILASFFSQSQASGGVAPSQAIAPSSRDELSSMITQMVDRLLVGDTRFNNKGEVQMKLSDSVLPQTELKIWRGEGGQLHVEFLSTSAESSALLASRLPFLAQRLNEQFANQANSLPVQVGLNQNESQDQMPQDGRSRQRYEPWLQEEETV